MSESTKRLRSEEYQEVACAANEPRMQTKPWCEVVPYTGKAKQIPFELCVKDGWFSQRPIAASDDKLNLEIMAYYIMHNPVCRSWRLSIRRSNLWARTGDFMIVERCGWKGDRELLTSLVKRAGGAEEQVDMILESSTEDVLGYVPSSDIQEVAKLARMVEAGATAPPSSLEDLQTRVDLMVKRAEYCERP